MFFFRNSSENSLDLAKKFSAWFTKLHSTCSAEHFRLKISKREQVYFELANHGEKSLRTEGMIFLSFLVYYDGKLKTLHTEGIIFLS